MQSSNSPINSLQAVTKRSFQKTLWKNSLATFSHDVLGFGKPPTLKTPPHILDWYDVLQDDSIKKILDLAPRSHAKTQVHSVNYVAWEIYRNPNIRAIIASNTAEMASAFGREIKEQIEQNANLVHLCPGHREGKWTDSAFTVRRTSKDRNQTLATVGANSGVLSKRADLIVLDDIVDEENSRTVGQRDRIRTWFWKTLFPVLEPNGKIVIVGTRWSYADLYGEILGAKTDIFNKPYMRDGWRCHVQQAILDEEKKIVLWAERWSYKKLSEMRSKQSAIFNCQYQNDPTALMSQKFKWEWFKWYNREGDILYIQSEGQSLKININDLDIFIGVDPAISQRESADFFALVVIGFDGNGRCFVLDYIYKHFTFNAQVEAILTKISQWKPIKVAIETVSYQQALKQEVDRLMTERRLFVPIKEIKTHKDKVTRSTRLSGMCESGKVFFEQNSQGELVDTLLQFPKGEHDDLFDGLDFAIEAGTSEEVSPGLSFV